MGTGCASPPPVGLYGSMPLSGEWAKAHRLTESAILLIDGTEPDLERGEALLRKAIEADPAHGPAYLQLGVVFENQRELERALRAYAWAHRLMPGHPEPHGCLKQILDQLEAQLGPRSKASGIHKVPMPSQPIPRTRYLHPWPADPLVNTLDIGGRSELTDQERLDIAQ